MKMVDYIAEPRIPNPESLPQHVAIIMDGNGRWAKSRGLPRTAGHKKGADALRRTLDNCSKEGIRYLTIYAFSSENWKRPDEEINDLMQLLQHYLHQELETLHQRGVNLHFIGDLSRLSPDIREQIQHAIKLTAKNSDFYLTIALSYGSRQEIVRAARKLAQMVKSGEVEERQISEELFAETLDTGGMPEPDLLIRTGGEKRLSNFLLWQSAYTEFYFTDTLWPDFDKTDLTNALNDFAKRERRYGTSGA
jgi:undecaprenyl diphosphate synthase